MIPPTVTRQEAYRCLSLALRCEQNDGPLSHDDARCETPTCWEMARLARRVLELEDALHDAREPLPPCAPCDRCGRRDGLDAVVSDDAWRRISGRSDGGGFLCLWCMDDVAAERGLDAMTPVRLHFAGAALVSSSEDETLLRRVYALSDELLPDPDDRPQWDRHDWSRAVRRFRSRLEAITSERRDSSASEPPSDAATSRTFDRVWEHLARAFGGDDEVDGWDAVELRAAIRSFRNDVRRVRAGVDEALPGEPG